MKVSNLKVLKNVQVSARYWHMVVEAPELVSETHSGQFFHIRCADEDFPFLRKIGRAHV